MTIMPSDESLKQGRNRSWQAVLTLNTPPSSNERIFTEVV